MQVHIYFHGNCLDGAVSAAIFSLFYRDKLFPSANFSYIPLTHTPGFRYQESDFSGDENAILDFRYAPSSRVKWFFDHHATTFMTPEDRLHFEKRNEMPPHCFWDPTAPSNAGFLNAMLKKYYGYKLPAIGERLLYWTDMIDSASFPSPEIPVELVELAPAFASLLESSTDVQETIRFIEDLVAGLSFDEMSRDPYWSNRLNRVRQTNWDQVEDIKRVIVVKNGVSCVDLSTSERSGYNKFIPYYLESSALFSVGLLLYRNRFKISVGTNPWHPLKNQEPVFDIGALCESFGGGGHCAVGAISLTMDNAGKARQVYEEVCETLQKHTRQLKLDLEKRLLDPS